MNRIEYHHIIKTKGYPDPMTIYGHIEAIITDEYPDLITINGHIDVKMTSECPDVIAIIRHADAHAISHIVETLLIQFYQIEKASPFTWIEIHRNLTMAQSLCISSSSQNTITIPLANGKLRTRSIFFHELNDNRDLKHRDKVDQFSWQLNAQTTFAGQWRIHL